MAEQKGPDVWNGVIARFPRAMKEIARVSEFGAEKYKVPLSDMSYLDCGKPDTGNFYLCKASRHMLDERLDGTYNPSDGNMVHRAQAAWNLLASLEALLKGKEDDQAYADRHMAHVLTMTPVIKPFSPGMAGQPIEPPAGLSRMEGQPVEADYWNKVD